MHAKLFIMGLLLVLATAFSATPAAHGATIVYVDRNATGSIHDGSSWCNAFLELHQAMASVTPPVEIHVAQGVYQPSSTGSRKATFLLVSEVAIYGGFAGCGQPNPDARDLSIFHTVLSGDLAGNDDPTPASTCCATHASPGCDTTMCEQDVCNQQPSCCAFGWDERCAALAKMLCCADCGNVCENSYHVVSGNNYPSTDETAILDGFTITAGFADGPNPSDRGAGIFNYFNPNAATYVNCTVRGNVATGPSAKAGGIYNHNSMATFTNCVIVGNVSPAGGGMYSIQSSPVATNCTFYGNVALVKGGGIFDWSTGVVALTSSVLSNNFPENIFGAVDASYSCLDRDPLFVQATGLDGVIATADDDLRLSPASPCINNGDPAFTVSITPVDRNGQPRRQGCRVDRGAYESSELQLVGDFNADSHVDLADFASFQLCVGVAGTDPWYDACTCIFDTTLDGNVDAADYVDLHPMFDSP